MCESYERLLTFIKLVKLEENIRGDSDNRGLLCEIGVFNLGLIGFDSVHKCGFETIRLSADNPKF